MKKVIDLSNIRATELKYNTRVYPPKAAEHKLETNLQQTKSALEEVFAKYTNENCDKKGELKNSNVTINIKEGIEELKKKVKEGDGVCMPAIV